MRGRKCQGVWCLSGSSCYPLADCVKYVGCRQKDGHFTQPPFTGPGVQFVSGLVGRREELWQVNII